MLKSLVTLFKSKDSEGLSKLPFKAVDWMELLSDKFYSFF